MNRYNNHIYIYIYNNHNHVMLYTTKLLKKLRPLLQSLNTDVQIQIQDTIKDWLKSVNLPTREEFDIQTRVLAKTREKVEHLEKMVNQLIPPE